MVPNILLVYKHVQPPIHIHSYLQCSLKQQLKCSIVTIFALISYVMAHMYRSAYITCNNQVYVYYA